MKTTNVSGIYIIKNKIDSRVYIGSAVSLSHRKGTHLYHLRNNKHANKHLQNFVNKYGIDKLYFDVLEFCEKEKLLEREQFYFGEYDNKFNIVKYAGNTLGRECPKEVRMKISKALKKAGLKGIPKSEETKKKMRKPKTKEHALNIKKAQVKTRKKVYQYSLDFKLIKEFESISDASKITSFKRQQISACCNNKQNTVRGFIFTFNKINEKNIDKHKSKIKNTLKYIKK